jgi:NAD-dependent DNA ligase
MNNDDFMDVGLLNQKKQQEQINELTAQTEQITNNGQITGNVVMSDDDYQALTTEEKENGKMYFTYEE